MLTLHRTSLVKLTPDQAKLLSQVEVNGGKLNVKLTGVGEFKDYKLEELALRSSELVTLGCLLCCGGTVSGRSGTKKSSRWVQYGITPKGQMALENYYRGNNG